MIFRLLVRVWMFGSFACGQELPSHWKEEVQRRTEARDWATAMQIVDRELARRAQDMELRTWHARILTGQARSRKPNGNTTRFSRPPATIRITGQVWRTCIHGKAGGRMRSGRWIAPWNSIPSAPICARPTRARCRQQSPKGSQVGVSEGSGPRSVSAEAHARPAFLAGAAEAPVARGVDSDLFNSPVQTIVKV